MTVDFQKLQDQVSETNQLVKTLLDRLNAPGLPALPAEESPLTVQQAADFLGLTIATVYDLVHNRRIPSHKPGKRVYFFQSELLEWVKNGRRSTTSELAEVASSRKTRQPGKRKEAEA